MSSPDWVRKKYVAYFSQSIDYMKTNAMLLSTVVDNRKKAQVITETEEIEKPCFARKDDAFITVTPKTTIDATVWATGLYKEVAVMDFTWAKSEYACGNEYTQEAELCRCSTLYPALKSKVIQSKFYQHNKSRHGGLGSSRAFYIPEVVVFNNESFGTQKELNDWCYINVIGMAAPDLSAYKVEIDDMVLKQNLKTKIDRMFHIVASEDNEAIVVGAWGCGYNKCPADIVATAFHECITEKWSKYFKHIIFAVPDYSYMDSGLLAITEKNFEVFERILKKPVNIE